MQLTITSMTYGSDGIARDASGKAVFVSGGLVGDTVSARIVEEGQRFSRAVVEEVLEPSPDRVQAPCPFVDICGGCPWGSLSLDAQRAAKIENLRSCLERIGGFSSDETQALIKPLRHAKDAWGYRNKIELTPHKQAGKLRLGMHGRNPQDIVVVPACPLFEKRFAGAVRSVAGAIGFLSGSGDLMLERVGIRASRNTGALEVALWTPTGGFPRAQVSRVLTEAIRPKSIVRVMSKEGRRARRVSGVEVLAGEGSWHETLAKESMRISAPSFFQVNTRAAEILIDLVMDALTPKPHEVAMDLYCGAGTFTIPLARRSAYVAAVEAYGPAVRDLRRNLEIAGLDNVDVIGGDAVREFPDEGADVLVVDPPRAGLEKAAIDLIAKSGARDIAYVSCDPATLARDLARFVQEGTYHPISATPADLFPQTYHMETVCHLTR
ncbi:23S rRNA (uracil(1939)-C(5))-methyltransferase RlmD [Collinsella sp. AGMB00827]|uniref:23S rRNA (Uracil(1939)-C(5))-methyltransferase RlmD n=1 Tax=Collinsella ureilytica TaxID=2869515 RepID=A0ABS7MHW3_9ACTN|nr:23S rRNA (uracil(1939)-C(5))-methyltransferase RlmD [Collinsella urealyticum]MBY4796949.1 23S rRNA (uracil(1939)-C(5))-methyltransferase RlmD [Collinsella urealyticum]